jgi:type I restriction enzyme R subunit
LPAYRRPLAFAYESTGEEIRFTNNLDPDPRSRDIFHFHKPETLLEFVQKPKQLRALLRAMPPLDSGGMWPAQIEAVSKLEISLAAARPRALIQMATGSGKTFTAANFIYRLVKYGDAKRILFLVDRDNLGKQTEREFRQFHPPGEAMSFGEIYNIQRLSSNKIGSVNRVVITTVQRLYSILRGEPEFDPANEQGSMFDSSQPFNAPPAPVGYNPIVPIEMFDFIVIDECHRSIYNLWRQVLEYFDGFLVGLTATPSKQTVGFFNRNLVMEYGHAQAVADGVNVNYDVYRIATRITAAGSMVEAGAFIDKRDRLTRKKRQELLDVDLTYTANQLDRDVVAVDQIRTVIRTFRDKLFTEIFPGRTEVPKTLIFAKDDSHAEDIVEIIREEFGRGNDFCQKITYKTGFMRVRETKTNPDGTSTEVIKYEKVSNLTPEDVLTAFRNSYNPRIAVTVDMVATGTDVKPLEIVFFMRNVKSLNFFEQMKGRGVRVIKPDELKAVTPDATAKTHFVIVDAVGVCASDQKSESAPLDRQPSVGLKKILEYVGMGGTDPDALSTLAARLARVSQEVSDEQREELKTIAGGIDLSAISSNLLRAIDPDAQIAACGLPEGVDPTPEQLPEATEQLVSDAVGPILKPAFRKRLLEIKQQNEQTLDKISLDEVVSAGYDQAALDKAKGRIQSFKQWIEDNKAEIIALQLIYSRRFANKIRFEYVKDLVGRIQRPPLNMTTQELWLAYEALEKSKVRGSGGKQLVDVVSLILHTVDPSEPLTPFQAVVIQRYERWIAEQQAAGVAFSDEQRKWLDKIAEHIATSVAIEREDFEAGWFNQQGSLGKAFQLFGNKLDDLISELNEKLVA